MAFCPLGSLLIHKQYIQLSDLTTLEKNISIYLFHWCRVLQMYVGQIDGMFIIKNYLL